jgi:hypothetical protein
MPIFQPDRCPKEHTNPLAHDESDPDCLSKAWRTKEPKKKVGGPLAAWHGLPRVFNDRIIVFHFARSL